MQQVVKLNICYDPDNELDNILCFHIPHHTSQFSLMSGTLSAGQTHEAAPLRGPGGCLTSKLREVGSLWNFSGPSGDKYWLFCPDWRSCAITITNQSVVFDLTHSGWTDQHYMLHSTTNQQNYFSEYFESFLLHIRHRIYFSLIRGAQCQETLNKQQNDQNYVNILIMNSPFSPFLRPSVLTWLFSSSSCSCEK